MTNGIDSVNSIIRLQSENKNILNVKIDRIDYIATGYFCFETNIHCYLSMKY